MHHEGTPSPVTPERHEKRERGQSPFDLERMEPRQIAGLMKAMAVARHSQEDNVLSPDARMYNELSRQLQRDLESLAGASDDALEVFGELVVGELASEDTQNSAAEMIPDLLRRNLDNPERKQQIVELAVHMLQGGGLGQEAANEVVTQIVWKDWLDEPTARYLDSYLHDEEDRRWS